MRILSGALLGLLLSTPTAMSQEPLQQHAVVQQSIPANDAIDFVGFVRLSGDLQKLRAARRVPIEVFKEISRDPRTIVLDTRSKRAFDKVHLAGAVHLNFSDFSEEKLRSIVPSKTTRILIYCNNNFKRPIPKRSKTKFRGKSKSENTEDTNGDGVIDQNDEVQSDQTPDIIEGFTIKSPRLALNIPTFINLHGYGYENVYELADQLELNDPRLDLVGTEILNNQKSH